jgi:hypothetical protein
VFPSFSLLEHSRNLFRTHSGPVFREHPVPI